MAVALLAAGFLVSTTVAAVEFVELQRARERIEELEAEAEERDGGGLLGELGETFEDLFGELGESLGEGRFGALRCLSDALGQVGAGDELSGPVDRQVGAIAERVEDIRDLEFARPVAAEFLSAGETTERVRGLLLEDYTAEAADFEEDVLTTLGAIPPGTDLRALRSDIIGSQVVGFYEPETGELVVRRAGEELSFLARVTLAHELVHALTDQALGIPLPDDPVPGREDEQLAALAVVEGDATFVMQWYAVTVSFLEQFPAPDPGGLLEAQAGLRGVPPYLQQELVFPYEAGFRFVCDLYAAGGWDAVNRTYEDPPESTAQILFPDRYRADEQPADPRDPGALATPWRPLTRGQLGAAQLLWLFRTPGGDPARALDDPMTGVSAWAGGDLHLWGRGEDSAVGIALAERPGEDVLCTAMSHWYAAAFPDARPSGSALRDGLALDGRAQDAVLSCGADEVRLGIGPDLRTARALVG